MILEGYPAVLIFHLQTTALPRASRSLAKAAVRIVSENIASTDFLHDLDLALFEACANVAMHAYPPDQPGELHIKLRITPAEKIQADIIDYGKGFDSLPVSITNAPPDAEHGRGLFLLSRLTDSLEISRENGATIVSFSMKIGHDQWIAYE